jgi:hypothetical protein
VQGLPGGLVCISHTAGIYQLLTDLEGVIPLRL